MVFKDFQQYVSYIVAVIVISGGNPEFMKKNANLTQAIDKFIT